MKPLNVLLINHVSRIGGAERSLLDLLPALKHEGISPTVAAPEGELLSRVRELNIPTRPLDIGRHRRPGSLPQLLKALYQLRKASAQIRSISELRPPDILHAVSLTAALPTAWAAEAIHRPSLWHCRDLRYPKQVLRMLARTPTRAIAISSTVAESLNSCRMRLQVQTCLNAIDTSRFNLPRSNRAALRAQFGLPTDGCLLLIAAHFVPWKRHDLALEAVAQLRTLIPNLHVAVAGTDLFDENPTYVARLNALTREYQLEQCCTWLGDVEDMPALYAASDLLLHPAEREPFGRVICEAMAARCPVVAINDAGPSEIITHGIDGYLAPPGHAPALAGLSARIFDEPQQTLRMVESAHRSVTTRFSIDRLARQISETYSLQCREYASHRL